ncbi:hypothetical protein [Reyranella sp.]|uniref:hypothetical protein n=1 Tax=Reyranella sp. TaxID=1929291 RepID=UPI00121F1390|nr:hypothetical protein [Reyranella sp.]TAJ84537.1 MAG: hypothetical protein EPO50_17760 [Reyranella sp.]
MQLRVLRGRLGPSRMPCRLPGAVILDGSVGYNGTNRTDDVVAIQSSLNSVLAAMGGPGEALAEDGIAGPKTQNAILRFQEHWVPWRDSKIEPDKGTLHALNRAVGSSLAAAVPVMATAGPTPVGAPKPPKPPAAPYFTFEDKQAIMQAGIRLGMVRTVWLPAAYRAALSAVRIATRANAHAQRLPAPKVAREDEDRLAFLLIAKHFKLHEKDAAAARAGAQRVETMIRRMCITLVNRVGKPIPGIAPAPEIFVSLWRTPAKVAGHPGYTYLGGAWQRHKMNDKIQGADLSGKVSPDYLDRIYLTPVFDQSHDDFRSHILVHELAHFIGDMAGGWTLDDLGYANEPAYLTNSSKQRLHNADAYACLVREAGFGTTRAALGAQVKASVLGKGPVVHLPEQPVLPAFASGTPDPYAYPSGGV